MVDALEAVAASAATTPTRVESSLSITSEPDNKWVAERQSQIDANLAALNGRRASAGENNLPLQEEAEQELPPLFEGHARRRKTQQELVKADPDQQEEAHLLSGESERIGLTNFDDDTPFGHRVAIL